MDAIWFHVFLACQDVTLDFSLGAYLLSLWDQEIFFYLARIHLGKFIYSLAILEFHCDSCQDKVFDQVRAQIRLLRVNRSQIQKKNHFWIKFMVPYKQEFHLITLFVDYFLGCES